MGLLDMLEYAEDMCANKEKSEEAFRVYKNNQTAENLRNYLAYEERGCTTCDGFKYRCRFYQRVEIKDDE